MISFFKKIRLLFFNNSYTELKTAIIEKEAEELTNYFILKYDKEDHYRLFQALKLKLINHYSSEIDLFKEEITDRVNKTKINNQQIEKLSLI